MADNKRIDRVGSEEGKSERPGWSYTKVIEPSEMTYEDGNGIWHQIYMPQGTFSRAAKHIQKKEWSELAKFQPWNNQKVTEDDYIYTWINDETGEPEEIDERERAAPDITREQEELLKSRSHKRLSHL